MRISKVLSPNKRNAFTRSAINDGGDFDEGISNSSRFLVAFEFLSVHCSFELMALNNLAFSHCGST